MKPSIDRAEMPARIRALPVNDAGYPVPWFVPSVDGKPDFRLMDERRRDYALRNPVCWVCGGFRGPAEPAAFVVGPMCSVNRTTAEPPSHVECADYSATHCPFLTIPAMHRREGRMPDTATNPGGEMIKRNPGVALVWITRSWRAWSDGRGGLLITMGEPLETRWYAEGRPATRAEVLESIDSGLPLLRNLAVEEGPAALADLMSMHAVAMQFVPA